MFQKWQLFLLFIGKALLGARSVPGSVLGVGEEEEGGFRDESDKGQLGSLPHPAPDPARRPCTWTPTESRPERVTDHPHPHLPPSHRCWSCSWGAGSCSLVEVELAQVSSCARGRVGRQRRARVTRSPFLCSSPQPLGHRQHVITLYLFSGSGFLSLSETSCHLLCPFLFATCPPPISHSPIPVLSHH